MAEPSLDRPGVVTLVGKGVAAGVAQHVRVGLELEACLRPQRRRSSSLYRRLLRLGLVLAEAVVVLGGPLRSASSGSAFWMSRASRLISRQDTSST